MATETTNYGLTKAGANENYDVSIVNENLDLVDAQMKANADAALSHKSRHATGGADALVPADIGAAPASHAHSGYIQGLTFAGILVTTASFVSDATYTNWPYRAAVALTGVTTDMVPDVVFDPDTATGGVLAPVAACYAGGVYLYAKSVPAAALTISTIACTKGVS